MHALGVECLKSGNWSQDEQSEPERFCRANTIGNRGPEFFIIGDRKDALKLDGSVGTVRSAVLVEELAAARDGVECALVNDESTICSFSLYPGDEIPAGRYRYATAVLLSGAIGVIHADFLGGIGQQTKTISSMAEIRLRYGLGLKEIGRTPARFGRR